MKRIIIDTDPGVDDLFAILMALGSPELRVEAITTTPGNVGIDTTTRNALRILTYAGRHDIPVYRGASHPIARPLHTASDVHGADGLHGMILPDPVIPQRPEPAVDYLCRTLLNADPNTYWLACLGPLTNLAFALRREPAIASRLGGVVLMGGGFDTYRFETSKAVIGSKGNVTPHAEFNIYADPEAAAEVVRSSLRLYWFPLDVTHQTLVAAPEIEELRTVPMAGPALAELASAYGAFSRKRWGTVAAPIHDANVISYLEAPERYVLTQGAVKVCTEQNCHRGETQYEESAHGLHHVALRFAGGSLFPPMLDRLKRVFAATGPLG